MQQKMQSKNNKLGKTLCGW